MRTVACDVLPGAEGSTARGPRQTFPGGRGVAHPVSDGLCLDGDLTAELDGEREQP